MDVVRRGLCSRSDSALQRSMRDPHVSNMPPRTPSRPQLASTHVQASEFALLSAPGRPVVNRRPKSPPMTCIEPLTGTSSDDRAKRPVHIGSKAPAHSPGTCRTDWGAHGFSRGTGTMHRRSERKLVESGMRHYGDGSWQWLAGPVRSVSLAHDHSEKVSRGLPSALHSEKLQRRPATAAPVRQAGAGEYQWHPVPEVELVGVGDLGQGLSEALQLAYGATAPPAVERRQLSSAPLRPCGGMADRGPAAFAAVQRRPASVPAQMRRRSRGSF